MKSLFRLTIISLSLLILCLLVLDGYRVYAADLRRQQLSEADITAASKACQDQAPKARSYIEPLRRQGLRTTDPRLFYSPRLNRCLYTYLLLDPRRPEATTFNRYLIYDVERNREVFLGEGRGIKTWQIYLERIAELEKR